MNEGFHPPVSGTYPASTYPTSTTAQTAPPPSLYSRAMRRERIDQNTMRSFGERRAYRSIRRNGGTSAWDGLEAKVVQAATTLWEIAVTPTPMTEDLAAFCAFLARELEVAEQMDLAWDADMARLRALAPRALDALDAISGPLLAEADAVTHALAKAFGVIRAELLVAKGADLWSMAA